jgi:cytochrome bd-type quinol oxidase subunit 2
MNPTVQTAGVDAQDVSGASDTTYTNTSDTGSTGVTDTSNTTTGVSSATSTNTTLSQIFGFFNIMVGLMLVAALLLFFGGFISYLTRLGLDNRVQGLRYMYWGLTILFVLIVLLGVVNYVQYHQAVVFAIVGVLVVIFVAWAVIKVSQASGNGDDEEH